MIVVHDIFVCKPGNASKLAKLFKETMTGEDKKMAVMTDLTGQYHRVIMASWHENLATFETFLEGYKNPTEEMKAQMVKMEGMNDMYVSGSREIFKVW
jgi:hypothetical protein